MSVQTDILTAHTLQVFISVNYRYAIVKRGCFAYTIKYCVLAYSLESLSLCEATPALV